MSIAMRRLLGYSQRILVRNFRSSAAVLSGGGGGRPGGKPVLNWKEKRKLEALAKEFPDVNQESNAVEPGDFGSFEELEKYYDLSQAKITELTDLDHFEDPAAFADPPIHQEIEEKEGDKAVRKRKRRQKGPRSSVQPSLLFGSHKSEGYMIPSRKAPSKVRFSHSRVFGKKKFADEGDSS